VPEPVRPMLEDLRRAIREAAPGATETISYRMPAYRLDGYLLYFAAFKGHVGLYAMPGAMRKFRKELAPFEKSKGTVRFPIGEPIPVGLIKRIVRFRVAENRARVLARTGRRGTRKR